MRLHLFFVPFLMGGFSSLCNAYVPYMQNINHNDNTTSLTTFVLFAFFFLLIGFGVYLSTDQVKTPKENIEKQEVPPEEERRVQESMSEMCGYSLEVDPVVEADTFLAFGRDKQAEEILIEALRKDPKNIKIKIKLLEIYSFRRDVTSFNETLLSLSGDLEPNSENWNKVLNIAKSNDIPIDLSSLVNDKTTEPEIITKDNELPQGLSAILSKIEKLLDDKDFKKVTINVKESKQRRASSPAGYTIIIKIN